MYKINLIILSVILITSSSFLIHQTFAQTDTNTEIPLVSDPGVAVASTVGVVGAATAMINSVMNNRKQNKNVKGTDVDFATSIILLSKIFQVCYSIDPKWRQVLDTKVSSNVLDKTTLGEAFTKEADGWASFIQEQYNVARPSMSVAQVQQSNSNITQKPTDIKPVDQNPK